MDKEFDNVNRPKHYQIKIGDHDFEMYEVIRSFVCKYPIELAYPISNAIKYLGRANEKNGLEDLRKARKCIDMLINDWIKYVEEDESK